MSTSLFLECARAALESVLAHSLRSLLTTFGILVGVAAVIISVSLVDGLSRSVSIKLQNMGATSVSVRAETPFSELMKGRRNRLTLRDLELIEHRVGGIENVNPVLLVGGNLSTVARAGAFSSATAAIGTTTHYQDAKNLLVEHGRFLSESDDRFRRRVAVLGDQLRRDLQLAKDCVGSYIEVRGEWLRIVGLAERRGDFLGVSQDQFLIVPFSVALDMNGRDGPQDLSISFSAKSSDELHEVIESVERTLRRAHRLAPGQPNDFAVETAESLQKSIDEVTILASGVIAAIVGISLVVGGVSVMNMMLVCVTERTREIGIARALGATRSTVLLQFLLEACFLSLGGGLIGVAVGVSASMLIGAAIPGMPSFSLDWKVLIGALVVSGLAGVVFGVFPARRAALLRPAEALRYE